MKSMKPYKNEQILMNVAVGKGIDLVGLVAEEKFQ